MDKILIVGLGVVGGSFALALQEAGYREVYGVDEDEVSLAKALTMGMIKGGSTDPSDLLGEADLCILAIYPQTIPDFITRYKDHFKKGALVTDVAGVKAPLAKALEALGPLGFDVILGHPMAGREKRGIDYASAAVFHGANYLLTPIQGNLEENLQKVENLVLNLGFKRVRRLSPQDHDSIIGYTSQLPHALAVALMNCDDPQSSTAEYIGDSYRDLTRIANINGPLWAELFLENKGPLLERMTAFETAFKGLKEAVASEDREGLMKAFAQSSQRRERLEKIDHP